MSRMQSQKSLMLTKGANSELTSYDKIKQSLKTSIFGVYYTLIKDYQPNAVLTIFLSVVELLQFMTFSFHPLLFSSWSSSSSSTKIVQNSYKVLIKFHIVSFFKNKSELPYFITLYVILFMLFLVIAIFIYIAYSFNRGFFSLLWPIAVMKKVLKIVRTILFLPILRLYLSVFQCDGSKHNIYIRSLRCFQSYHFIHIFASIISMILLIFINLISVLLFYRNYNFNTENLNTIDIMKNSNSEQIKLIIKVVLSLVFTVIDTGTSELSVTSQWLIIFVLNILSINNFIYLYTKEIYTNQRMQIFHSCLALLYMWLNITLGVSKLVNYFYNFQGGIYLFLSGFVLIIILMIFSKSSNRSVFDKIHLSFAKITKGEEICDQLRIYLELIVNRGRDRESEMILRGSVKNHYEICIFNDCPLKLIKNNFLSIDTFAKNQQVSSLFFTYLNKMYIRGLSKFPNCTRLRIEYIQFLFVFLKQRLKALSEIENLEKNALSFEKEFITFKIKKMILDDQDNSVFSSKDKNNLDILDNESNIAYESHFHQCQSTILVSSKLFLDFWSKLSNTNNLPDIYKLNSLGEKINDCLKNINNHWSRMQHYKPNDPKALKMYSNFVGQILNDKEKANEIISLSKGTNTNENILKKIESEYKDELAMGNGIICIGAESENFGVILKATANVSKIFGYLLNDIVGRNIDDFFVEGYNGYVSHYIREKFKENEAADLLRHKKEENTYIKNEKLFYGKGHNQRINTIYLTVLNSQAINEKLQIKIIVRKYSVNTDKENNLLNDDKKFVNVGLFLVNANLNILAYNDDGATLASIIYGKITSENNSLSFYFPEILHNEISQSSTNKITETHLIDLYLDNLNNIHNYTNTVASRDFYFSVHNVRKHKKFPDALGFIEEQYYTKEKPVLTTIRVNTLEDLKTIDEEISTKDLRRNKNNNNNNSVTDNSIVPQSETPEANDTVYSNKNVRDINYDTIYENIKEKLFIIEADYSLADRFSYGKCANDSIGTISKSSRNNEEMHKYFETKMISSPPLQIQVDKVLDHIIEEKKKAEDLGASRLLDKSGAVSNGERPIGSQNLMTFLKDKDHFFKLYSFEGIGFYNDMNFHESKEDKNKTLQELKKESIEKGNREDPNINRQGTSKFFEEKNVSSNQHSQRSFNKQEDFGENNDPNKAVDEAPESGQSEFYNMSGISGGNHLQSAQYLLNVHSDLTLREFKTKLENLRDHSTNVSLFMFQNELFNAVKTPQPQILTFMKRQEEIANNVDNTLSSKATSSNKTKSKTKKTSKFSQAENQKTLKSLFQLQLASIITLVILIVHDIINFVLNTHANNKTQTNLNLIDYSYHAINQIVFSSYLLRNLLLATNKTFKNYLYEASLEEFRNMNIRYLTAAQEELDYIIRNISNNGLNILEEHSQLIKEPEVTIYFLSEDGVTYSSEKRTLIQSLSDMRIYILTIANYPDQSLHNNTLVNNLMYNSFNDFLIKLRRSASLYTELMINNDKFHIVLFAIMFVVIVVICIVETVVMSKIFIKVDNDRTKIMCLFYEIPQEYINELSKKCIKFIEKNEKIKNRVGHEDEEEDVDNENEELIDSTLEIMDQYDNYSEKNKKRQRINNIKEINKKQNSKTILKVIITFLLVICVFLVEFTFNYFLYSNMDEIIEIFNTTAQTKGNYIFTLNLEREKILKKDFIALNTSGLMLLNQTMEDNYDLNNKLIIKIIDTSNYFSGDVLDQLNNILNENVCPYLSLDQCETRLNGIGQFGCEVITVRFFEFVRLIIQRYIKSEIDYDPILMLNGELFTNITLIMHYYMMPLYDELTNRMRDNIKSILDHQMNFRTILFSVYLVLVILIYLVIWIPKQNRLNDEIIRTKTMLEIIPTDILDKLESSRKL